MKPKFYLWKGENIYENACILQSVIYFGVVDFEAERPNIKNLDWICIDDKTYE